MLDNFAPEVAVPRIEKKPVELVGFVSEATLARAPSVSARTAKEYGSVPAPTTLLQAGSVCALLTIGGLAVPGRAAPAAPLSTPEIQEIQHTRVFVATTPVNFSIAPRRRNYLRQTTPAKSVSAAKSLTRPATPLVVARAPQRVPQKPEALQPRGQPITASTPITPRGVGTSSASVAPVAAVAMRSASEETEVRRILERLRGAYERLDARAARQVWPSLDEPRLARAFSTLKSQELDFEECRIDLASTRGVALCRGRATYVGRFGKREPETQNRRWTFQVRKTGDSWAIDSVRSE